MEAQNCGYLLRLKHRELISIVSVIQTLLVIDQELKDPEMEELSLKGSLIGLLEHSKEDIALCRDRIYDLQMLPDGKLNP